MSKNKKKLGRPPVMTPEKVREIEGYFTNGANDLESCFLAGISRETLYAYQREHPDFIDRKKALRNMTAYKARMNIKRDIDLGDNATSKWYLERKDSEFKEKRDITSNDEAINKVLVEFLDGDKNNTNPERV